jgi:hypothetical protein
MSTYNPDRHRFVRIPTDMYLQIVKLAQKEKRGPAAQVATLIEEALAQRSKREKGGNT